MPSPTPALRPFGFIMKPVISLALLTLSAAWPLTAKAQDYDPLAERAAAAGRPVPKTEKQDLPPVAGPAQERGERRAAERNGGGVTREALPPKAAFEDRGEGVQRDELAPAPASLERGRGVEREELGPVMSPDGSGLPHEVWGGISEEEFAASVGGLSLPPKSPALAALWRRVVTADTLSAPGTASPSRFTALRIEAMDQSGLIDEVAAVLDRDPAAGRDPLLRALAARSDTGLGNTERGCEIARGLLSQQGALPATLRADVLLINGLCAAERGDMEGASLQAGLLRDLDLPGVAGIDLLDAVAGGLKPEIPAAARLGLVDYRILTLKGEADRDRLIAAATPALLVGLARDPRAAPDVRLAAGEAAARLNLISAQDLAPLYRASGAGGDAGTIERAGLFKSAESERTPLRKARLIRAFLDEARRAGLYWPALQTMQRPAREVTPLPEIGWFAETAIEIHLVAGNFEEARRWAGLGDLTEQAEPGSLPLAHWAALADIADPAHLQDRARSLGAVEQMAAHGRFDPELLHRLATVLDALDINVPIPLWDIASRTAQPAGGHLPDTGVLSALADASHKKSFAKTVLLVMRTLGPAGAEGAHMIALGDSIRALKRAGLDAEARQLGLEALFAGWPRTVNQ